jgi:hypothetical protein
MEEGGKDAKLHNGRQCLRRRRRKGHFKNTLYCSVTVFYRVHKVKRSGDGQVAGYCECGNELLGSIKCG